jgi:putative peptidoglycan lipid II flippase
MNRARHLLRSSVIVIVLFGLGKLTGLVRTRLVSTTFGTGSEFDAFTAANQLPEVFFTVIAGGSLAAAFIPVYSEYLTNRPARESARLANTILTLVILLLGAISALGAIFAPWLVSTILVPGFPPEIQALTAAIMQVILIQTTLFGISGVLSSILNAHQHFALPALAPVMLDLGYMIGIIFLVPRLGIMGLAWGTVIGAILHIAVQIPALLRFQFRYRPSLALRMAGVREIIILMIPRFVTLGTIQFADLFIIRLASSLPVGSTSGYFYAYALMQFPETLFGTAIALVVFPTMAELFNAGDLIGLRNTASRTIRIIWFLTFPAAAGLVLLGRPVITLLLQGGEFTADSAQLVYSVLVVFSLRVISESTVEVAARLFYAQHNTAVPMVAYLGWLILDVALAYWLVDELGIVALAIASTVAFTFLAAVLLVLNDRNLDGLLDKDLALSALRALTATAGMTVVVYILSKLIDNQLLLLGVGGLSGAVTYLILSLLLGGDEIPQLITLVRSGRQEDEGTIRD